ncbi:MAG: SH3 domain-containing protein [Sphingomicrobium sp.]
MPVAEGGYPLFGPSNLPDPTTHAYRQDLADIALAGRVIASHYAEPLARQLKQDGEFRLAASDESETIDLLKAGSVVQILDNSRGWAWGYGPDGRVGYLRSALIEV